MATKKPSKKPAAKSAAPVEVKPVKDSLTKAALASHIAEQTEVEVKNVKKVLAALEAVVLGSLHKKGLGEFTLPGLLKVVAQKVAAKTASPWLSVIYPASTTPCCHQAIAWHDNIPVLSWLLLRGRCRHCQQPISLRYPMVECMTSIAIVWAFMHFGLSWIALWYCLLLAILIALFFIDLDTCYLPDDLTYSALWLGLLGSALGILPLLPANAILGACAGYALSWSVNAAYWLLRRRDGFRGGDFKLMATLGAWLGVSAILPILAVASALALLGVVALMLVRREQFSWGGRLPCGPFLIAAGVFIAL